MQKELMMKKTIRTKDLYLSAFFHAKGLPLKKVERDGSICWFIFNEVDDELINNFWSGEGTCSVKSFVDAVRTLKDRIYSEL